MMLTTSSPIQALSETSQNKSSFSYRLSPSLFRLQWDAFSIPELCNFLRFLEKEEKEQGDAIRRRYDNYRQKLQEALRAPPGAP